MIHIRLVALALLCAMTLACTTQQAYSGAARAADEVALIKGDPKFRLTPVAVYLRSVDGKALADTQASVQVLPGEHELVVDCVVSTSGDRQRIRLQIMVQAGERYRLEPQLVGANQACETVRLILE